MENRNNNFRYQGSEEVEMETERCCILSMEDEGREGLPEMDPINDELIDGESGGWEEEVEESAAKLLAIMDRW